MWKILKSHWLGGSGKIKKQNKQKQKKQKTLTNMKYKYCSKNNASYCIMLAHNTKGGCCY